MKPEATVMLLLIITSLIGLNLYLMLLLLLRRLKRRKARREQERAGSKASLP